METHPGVHTVQCRSCGVKQAFQSVPQKLEADQVKVPQPGAVEIADVQAAFLCRAHHAVELLFESEGHDDVDVAGGLSELTHPVQEPLVALAALELHHLLRVLPDLSEVLRSDLCQIGAEIAELVDVLGGVENIYQFGQRIL